MARSSGQFATLQSLVYGVAPKAECADRCDYVVIRLFDEVGSRLLTYVLSLGLQRHDAEDVVQETFLSLFRHLQLERPRNHLHGWLFRVAHLQALKRRHADKLLDRNVDFEAVVGARSSASTGADESFQFEQNHRRLQAVLRALPERDRRCLVLKAEGVRYREIAQIMRMSLGAVSLSISRTLARMARAEGT
jgi:RNA polymerase sigma-70 factor (ECF subfamily)